jgi:hypothetical protein
MNSQRFMLWVINLGVAFCLTFNGGCSSSGLYSVTGKVTDEGGHPIDGLTGSEVMFIGGNSSSVGEIKADGSFSMYTNKPGDGVPPGDYTVYFPRRRIDSEREAPQSIATKFEKPEASGLEAKVEKKSNRFEFKVARAGKK